MSELESDLFKARSKSRILSKLGAERVVDLTKDGFWDDCRFFRVLNNFMAQWGINGSPEKNKKWKKSECKT